MQDRLASRHRPREQVGKHWGVLDFLRCYHTDAFSGDLLLSSLPLQHRWQVWCGLLRQCVDQQQWWDVLVTPGYLSQHLCHRNHLFPIWLSELHPGLQVQPSYFTLRRKNEYFKGALKHRWFSDLTPSNPLVSPPQIPDLQCQWGWPHLNHWR